MNLYKLKQLLIYGFLSCVVIGLMADKAQSREDTAVSAGKQVSIDVVKDAHFLDGKYTAFGKVTKGMAVADKIVSAPRDERDNPLEPISMKITIKSKK